jgi:hypothetical protein
MLAGIVVLAGDYWFLPGRLQMFLPHLLQVLTTQPFLELPPREIAAVLFLLSMLWLSRLVAADKPVDPKTLMGAAALFAFIPVASFADSVDMGFYLSAALLLMAPVLYVSLPGTRVTRVGYFASLMVGAGAGVLTLALVFGGGFFAFLKYTFVVMPPYKELMQGFRYPIWVRAFFGPCVLIAANTYWICVRALCELQKEHLRVGGAFVAFARRYREETCLLFLSLFFFRSALGRSDWVHAIYSLLPTYLLSLHIGLKHYMVPIVGRHGVEKAVTLAALIGTSCVCVVGVHRVVQRDLLTENFPVKIPDARFMPSGHPATIEFIKRTLKERATTFVTMTNEGIWYYYLQEPCPTRFPLIYIAAPRFLQQEVVDDFERKHVGLVLWKSALRQETMDYLTNEERLPIIVDYLKRKYAPFAVVEGNELWMRRDILPPGQPAARESRAP